MQMNCYLRDGVVYLPVTGPMGHGGPWVKREPIAVVDVADAGQLRRAFHDLMARGNPAVPKMTPAEMAEPVLPRYAGVKSWSTFERRALTWSMNNNKGFWEVTPYRKWPSGGYVPDLDRRISLPPSATVEDLCDRMIEILQTAADQDRRRGS